MPCLSTLASIRLVRHGRYSDRQVRPLCFLQSACTLSAEVQARFRGAGLWTDSMAWAVQLVAEVVTADKVEEKWKCK